MTNVVTSEEMFRDRANELRLAKEKIVGPVPLLAEAPENTFTLPRGLFDGGTWHTEVEIRELTGADEEMLAKAKDPVAFFSQVIASGVTRVGTLDFTDMPMVERKGRLGELLIGEREQLYIKIAAVSFGNEKIIGFTCTNCGETQEVTLLLDNDFQPREVENISQTLFTYTTAKGDELEYRPALGNDQDEVLSRKGISTAEQNTLLLSTCIAKRNGELLLNPIEYARSLGMRDRQKLMVLLMERQPSVSLDLTTHCATCDASQSIGLGWGDIFRP